MVIVRLSMFVSFLPVGNPNLLRFCIIMLLMNIILGLTVELTATPSVQVMLENISFHALNYSPIHCFVLESLAASVTDMLESLTNYCIIH